MFGYVVPNFQALPEDRQKRFRAFYCGLCRTLRKKYGVAGSATLSYDMTFLSMLLHALYELEERGGAERCAAHPVRAHDYVESDVMDYVADVNIALAYHKLHDDWMDDKNLISAGGRSLLKQAYRRVKAARPQKCEAIETWLSKIHDYESEGTLHIDLPVNATGNMLGELFIWPEQTQWAQALRNMGNGLGRFIYFMDAYDDLRQDVRKGRYNPLKALMDQENYEALCRAAMMAMVAETTEAFEGLPVILDADILRNILYSGVWTRYAFLQDRRNEHDKGER